MATSMKSPFSIVAAFLLSCSVLWICPPAVSGASAVVINELHTNPDVKTDLVEFIELYNTGSTDQDLSGWTFSEGVFYTFPAGSVLPGGGYLIVAQNPGHILSSNRKTRFSVPGAIVFGPFEGKLSNEGEAVVLRDASGEVVDEVEYGLGFPWPTVGDAMVSNQPGTGRSMQLVNPAFDNDLAGSWRSGAPTPGAQNSVFASNIAPIIRQVNHTPNQPRSGQAVTITAKITDRDGIMLVGLNYQIVEPGQYRALESRLYDEDWVTVMMTDDGRNGDLAAGDDIYTVQLPASIQAHRRLIRYRITLIDNLGFTVDVPYPDDPQPNFAYFVYDDVPAWTGAVRPGQEEVQYGSDVMQSLPIYHLIAEDLDVFNAMHIPGTNQAEYWGSDYPWEGTLVYDGVVYDHIRFRARGGVWRYSMGKNMWKFDFNRGHYFQARDDYGRKYDTKWGKMNFSACIQQGDYQHRGEQGMFEAATFKLFNMMGVEAPKTNWVHFRVIDDADETGRTQYDGDFWGLYMTLEQMDGRFLDEHGLPDGNLYKMEGGSGDLNNQGPTAVTDRSDLNHFQSGYRSRPDETWWRQNVNVQSYYGYRCVVEGVHHGDIAYGKNWFFYLNPETHRWSMLPWDVDLTWANNMYGSGEDDFRNSGRIFNNQNLNIEFQNRQREFFDLLYNTDQLYQLLDEMADIIDPPTGGPTFVEADRAMWDYNPIMNSVYVSSSKAGQGRFYQRADTHDFRGMVQIMKDYVVSDYREFDTYYEDSAVPDTPQVTATGPESFPINALTFRTTPFDDPQGAQTFEAMQWRIAEVSEGSQPSVEEPWSYVFVPDGAEWRYFKGTEEPSSTVGAWRAVDFDDSGWLTGRAAIGYGEAYIATELNDMRGQYTTVYLRRTFDATHVESLQDLILEVKYDDGVNVWINDHLVYQDNVASDELSYDAMAIFSIEAFDFFQIDLGTPGDILVEGTNVITVQLLNATLFSSDVAIDVRLTAERAEDNDGQGQGPAQIYRGEPGKYEIDSVWGSGELTEFNEDITIPASVVKSDRVYRVRCRMKDDTGRWSHWSAPVQFVTSDAVAAGILSDLRITEVMYNPSDWPGDDTVDNDEFEFIELKNIGDETLDLTTVSLTEGVHFDFSTGDVTTLRPGQFVLVVRNREAFLSRYGTSLAGIVAGQYEGKLSNDGEDLELEDFWNGTVVAFQYNDGRGWPLTADGAGHSLVPLTSAILSQPEGSLRYGGNWRASAYLEGSPGADDPEPVATLLINEFIAYTTGRSFPLPAVGPNDWIELYNPTNAPIDLADWYLSDDPTEPKKWALPEGVVEPHGFISFDEDTGFNVSSNTGFGLNRTGETVVLSYLPGTVENRIVDAVEFEAQEPDISLGPYPDGGSGWFRLEPSRDTANTLPIADIIIDEIMYHPADANDEYVELYNPTDGPIQLASAEGPWRLNGAIEYTFDDALTLPAGGCLVVVEFDPVLEASRLSAFLATYVTESLVPEVVVVGPWQGALANEGERVVLEKPLAGNEDDEPIVWAIVDEVIYSDVAPWPTRPDGMGDALHRISTGPADSGNDPTHWGAGQPSPGIRP